MGNSISNYNYGKQNAQFGPGSHMTVSESQGSTDTVAVLREMVTLIQELRSQVTPAERATLDHWSRVLGSAQPQGFSARPSTRE